MKFVLTIESNDLEDLTWIASRLRMGGTATAVVGPAVNFPDIGTGDPLVTKAPEPTSEPEAPKKKIGRPPKAAAPAAVSEAAEPAKAATPAPKAANGPTDTLLPSLDALKGAVTTAVRKAQKSEGTTAILDLLGGFKDVTGLDYVMNAKEEHKPALMALLAQAGIQIPV